MPTIFSESFFHFKAERLAVGKYKATLSPQLAPDASNLAAVLNNIEKIPRLWEEFKRHVRDIFPSVDHVVLALVDGGNIQIELIQPTKEGQRDVPIPLSESGTGIGQVLAILYVAMTQRNSCIIIDEPNSFLHPGAVKKLINILKGYSENQYIISTHSPELIATADPSNILLVEKHGAESSVRQINRKELGEMKGILDDLGVSLSDVFGCDQVVWVEGQTEAACFPMVLKHFGIPTTQGLSFIPLAGATDFDVARPKARKIIEVYNRLTGTSFGLIPTTVAFSLDQEERSAELRCSIVNDSKGKVHYLPRKMFENYLLDADAISHVLSTFGSTVPPATVSQWMTDNQAKYPAAAQYAIWLDGCDAALFLSDLFSTLTDAKVEFHKTTHSPALTAWILEHRPAALHELRDYIKSLLE